MQLAGEDQPEGSSPHTRGARADGPSGPGVRGIIPAYAGSTASRGGSAREAADHPRIRGEHNKEIPAPAARPGSSPHTRGAPDPASRPDPPGRIIPAYAGSTLRSSPRLKLLRDHPRIRGEHVRAMDANGLAHGSSPHTRGARMGRVHDPRRRRIIPAYAGSTTATAPLARKGRDHPRIRGEHQPTHDTPATTRGSSPHTRGARIGSAAPATSVGIIPAYAGSTTTNAPYHLAGADHPRIRGEHEPNTNDAQSEAGSSPHTRGAPRD